MIRMITAEPRIKPNVRRFWDKPAFGVRLGEVVVICLNTKPKPKVL